MKTFKKSYLPDKIEHSNRVWVLDGELSANVALGKQVAFPKDLIKVVVTNPRLRGKTDLHGKPYPSTVWYFKPESITQIKEGTKVIARDPQGNLSPGEYTGYCEIRKKHCVGFYNGYNGLFTSLEEITVSK